MQRVEERDLYSCLVTIRVPEIEKCHSGCPECTDDETRLNLKIVKKLHSDDGMDLKLMLAQKICDKFKNTNAQSTLTEKHLWIEVIYYIHNKLRLLYTITVIIMHRLTYAH